LDRVFNLSISIITRGGRAIADAQTIIGWAQETNYPGLRAAPGDLADPSNWDGGQNQPHIHLPGTVNQGHIPVGSGVTPIK